MDDLGKLIEDIYKHTGQKVEVNDPIVSAAFLQSRLFENAVNNLKESLPKEISKIAIDDLNHAVIEARKELIEISNGHKKELEKSQASIVLALKNEITNNTSSIANIINNDFYKLLLFGLFCGVMGGLAVVTLQIIFKI